MNHFPVLTTLTLLTGLLAGVRTPSTAPAKKPNIVIVMADQWRAQDLGYSGNREVITPNLDKLASEAVNARFCVASVPVCAPSRASMLTGQHAHTHGVFYNDRPLRNEAVTLAEVCQQSGYQTGFIGKWHINGGLAKDYAPGRLAPIPVERRQGFQYWRALECTHDYNNSPYYNEVNQRFVWQQYDAISQTDSAIGFYDPKTQRAFPARARVGATARSLPNGSQRIPSEIRQSASLAAAQCPNQRHDRGSLGVAGILRAH